MRKRTRMMALRKVPSLNPSTTSNLLSILSRGAGNSPHYAAPKNMLSFPLVGKKPSNKPTPKVCILFILEKINAFNTKKLVHCFPAADWQPVPCQLCGSARTHRTANGSTHRRTNRLANYRTRRRCYRQAGHAGLVRL